MSRLFLLLYVCVVLQSCASSRALVRWSPDINDHRFLPNHELVPGPDTFNFAEGDKSLLADYKVDPQRFGLSTDGGSLDDFLAGNDGTVSFLVIRNDSILYENYFNGHRPQDISCVFSVTKSITSLLTGIAIDEGYIKSVDDPVTDYLPELARKHPYWKDVTIAHLLDMRAGTKFNEDSRMPFSKSAAFYYGNSMRKRVGRLKFEAAPGEVYNYQTAQTAVLGLVLESAIGRNLGEYFHEKVWLPLGMEHTAKWNIDDRKNDSSKAGSGLSMTAIDLAKIGRLYLNRGMWDGNRIVSKEWIDETFSPGTVYHYSWRRPDLWLKNMESEDYYFDDKEAVEAAMKEFASQNGQTLGSLWESDRVPGKWGAYVYPEVFMAIGIYQQILYLDPARNIIVVRLGAHGGETNASFIFHLIRDL